MQLQHKNIISQQTLKQIHDQLARESKLQSKRTLKTNHTLIYSLSHYRKSVTKLALDSLKKKASNILCEFKQNQFYPRANLRRNQSQHRPKTYQNNSIIVNRKNQKKPQEKQNIKLTQNCHTKKKKYSYGVVLDNEQEFFIKSNKVLQKNFYRFNQPPCSNKPNLKIKNHSLISKQGKNYITTAFKAQYGNKSKNQNSQSKESMQANFSQFENVSLDKIKRLQNSKLKQRKNCIKSVTQLSHDPSKRLVKNKIMKELSKKSLLYPKTETYTARSEYNIQKLSDKLDSYIRKHIKQQ